MKRSAKIMSLAMALSVTAAMVPLASAQSNPPPASSTQQYAHPKANGAAKGAIIGGAMGNAGAGAVIGAGHSRRQERRDKRRQ
jgi:hypothetical protein